MAKAAAILNIILITFTMFLTPAYSEDAIQDDSGILNRERLTGDWGGFRNSLETAGITIDAMYKGEVWGSAVNGRSESCYTDNIDLTGLFELENLVGVDNTNLFIHVLGNNGKNIADYAGAGQGISNIAAYNTWKIFQLYLETSFFNNRLNMLVGMYDLNSQFDCKVVNQLFINPSHGIGVDWSQSGENGPSIFPTASFGLRIRYSPVDNTYIQLSALDGVAGDPNRPNGTHIVFNDNDGLLTAVEAGFTKGNKTCALPGNEKHKNEPYTKLALGYWHYTDSYSHIVSGIYNQGLYLIFEQDLFLSSFDNCNGLSLVARAGVADAKVNQFDFYFGGGLVYRGVFQESCPDELGVSFASAHNSGQYRETAKTEGRTVLPFEHIFELTYKYYLTPALALQPDFQYVIDPCNSDTGDDALLFGLRLIAAF